MKSFAELSAAFARSREGIAGAVAEAGPEIELLAAGGATQGISDQLQPDGTPYPPLKFPRVGGGNKRLLDKGLLQASISAAVTETELVMRANSPGARVQHWGATIRPVKGTYLAFQVGGGGGRKGKAGARWIFAKSVTIPGMHYLGASAATVGRIGGALSRGFVKFMAGLLKE